jgi:hypothetical protein
MPPSLAVAATSVTSHGLNANTFIATPGGRPNVPSSNAAVTSGDFTTPRANTPVKYQKLNAVMPPPVCDAVPQSQTMSVHIVEDTKQGQQMSPHVHSTLDSTDCLQGKPLLPSQATARTTAVVTPAVETTQFSGGRIQSTLAGIPFGAVPALSTAVDPTVDDRFKGKTVNIQGNIHQIQALPPGIFLTPRPQANTVQEEHATAFNSAKALKSEGMRRRDDEWNSNVADYFLPEEVKDGFTFWPKGRTTPAMIEAYGVTAAACWSKILVLVDDVPMEVRVFEALDTAMSTPHPFLPMEVVKAAVARRLHKYQADYPVRPRSPSPSEIIASVAAGEADPLDESNWDMVDPTVIDPVAWNIMASRAAELGAGNLFQKEFLDSHN